MAQQSPSFIVLSLSVSILNNLICLPANGTAGLLLAFCGPALPEDTYLEAKGEKNMKHRIATLTFTLVSAVSFMLCNVPTIAGQTFEGNVPDRREMRHRKNRDHDFQRFRKEQKRALKNHQKEEKRALKRHQRDEHDYFENSHALREHHRAERADLKRHQRDEKRRFKQH